MINKSKNKIKIKKGDEVIVLAGKNKGKTGKVLTVMPSINKLVVAGINIAKKHIVNVFIFSQSDFFTYRYKFNAFEP